MISISPSTILPPPWALSTVTLEDKEANLENLREATTARRVLEINSRVERVIVGRDRLVQDKVEGGSVVPDSLLEFHTHGIGVEDTVVVDVGGLDDNNYFFTDTIWNIDGVNKAFEFDTVGEIIVDSKVGNDFIESELNLNEVISLENSSSLETSIGDREVLGIITRSEDIGSRVLIARRISAGIVVALVVVVLDQEFHAAIGVVDNEVLRSGELDILSRIDGIISVKA
jgi:hypothetical protein